jgi:hypothetical protein
MGDDSVFSVMIRRRSYPLIVKFVLSGIYQNEANFFAGQIIWGAGYLLTQVNENLVTKD